LHDRVLPDLSAADLALRTALARGDEPALELMVPPESPASADESRMNQGDELTGLDRVKLENDILRAWIPKGEP